MDAVAARQLPLIARQQKTVGQRDVIAEILRVDRCSMMLQIVRRRTHHPLDGDDLAGDQARRFQFGNAKRDVEAVLDGVEKIVTSTSRS